MYMYMVRYTGVSVGLYRWYFPECAMGLVIIKSHALFTALQVLQ